MLAEDKSGIDMHLSSAKNAPKKDSAVAKCAEFILKTLQAMHDTENVNGMTWDSLITKAGLEGMKPKTMRLARTYLRSTAKLLVLYQCKSPGTRNMKYMWALASVPLPANAEVLDTYEEDTEEVYGFASLAAVVASARRTSPGGAQRLAVQVPAAGSWDCNSAQAAAGFAWPAAGGRLSDGNNHAAPTFSPDAAASRSCSGSLAHEGSMSSYPSPHAVASGHGQALSDTAGDDTCGRSLDGANNRVGGGVGQRLKYEDLQAQFGFGLGEAAANLGVCKTTLKRACRSHGIRRWPRKQIAKLSKALSTVSKHGLVPAQIGQVVKESVPAVMQQQGHSPVHQANLPAVSQTQVLAALEPPGQLLAKPMQQQEEQMPQVEKQQQQQQQGLGRLASVLLSEQQSREAMHLPSPRDVAMPAATKADLPGTLLSFMLQQQRQNPQPPQHQAVYSMMPRAAPAAQQGLLCHQLSLMQRHPPQLQSGSYSLDMGPVYLDGLPFNALPSAAVVPAGYSQAGLRQSLAYNVRAHMGAPMNVVACPPYSVIILG